jgi:hypothetical protein
MPTRTITAEGKTWRVMPSGRVTQYDRDEFSLMFIAGTGSDRFYESVGWTRLGALPLYSARPDGSLADGAFYYLEL